MAMRQYSIAKVTGDAFGFGSLISDLTHIRAKNYDDAVDKAIHKLNLKRGDTLSIIALQGKMPIVKGFSLPGRYEYRI